MGWCKTGTRTLCCDWSIGPRRSQQTGPVINTIVQDTYPAALPVQATHGTGAAAAVASADQIDPAVLAGLSEADRAAVMSAVADLNPGSRMLGAQQPQQQQQQVAAAPRGDGNPDLSPASTNEALAQVRFPGLAWPLAWPCAGLLASISSNGPCLFKRHSWQRNCPTSQLLYESVETP